jgi:stage V sporulation protein SpoVS
LSDGFIAAIKGARWLHVSGITQAISTQACDTALQAMALARESGVRVSYDLNFRPRLWPAARAAALARASLAYTDLFLPSIDEAQTVLGVSSAQELIDWSLAQGARAVAVKRGALGACVSSGQELVDIPAWPVRAVDATGAGDCFGGVTVARLLAGRCRRRSAGHPGVRGDRPLATLARYLGMPGRRFTPLVESRALRVWPHPFQPFVRHESLAAKHPLRGCCTPSQCEFISRTLMQAESSTTQAGCVFLSAPALTGYDRWASRSLACKRMKAWVLWSDVC